MATRRNIVIREASGKSAQAHASPPSSSSGASARLTRRAPSTPSAAEARRAEVCLMTDGGRQDVTCWISLEALLADVLVR